MIVTSTQTEGATMSENAAPYSNDKDAKRIVAPDESRLNVKETLTHLNNMYLALDTLYYSWGAIHESVELMERVFLGASVSQQQVEEHAVIEDEPEVEVEAADSEAEVESS